MHNSLSFLQEGLDSCQDGDALQKLRHRGWAHFQKLGLPDKTHEAYRYLPLRKLYEQQWGVGEYLEINKTTFQHVIAPESEHSYLVFVNGYLDLGLSDITALPPQIQVMGLNDAIRSHSSFLSHRFTQAIMEEKDPFAALNLSMHGRGAFVYVPPKIELATPIQLLYVTSGNAIWTFPRLQGFIGSQSKIQCKISSVHIGAVDAIHCCNAVIDMTLDDGAVCQLDQWMSASDHQWSFTALRASLKRDSRLSSVTLSGGGVCARQNDVIILKGERAEVKMQGLTVLNHNSQSHSHLLIEHQAPHTQSMQRFKTVVQDHAQASFEGKIHVHSVAQKTQAYQLNNNLILDGRAIVNSKPNLEVFADDVKASHGVTVSQLDPQLLFYFKTRGISEAMAKELMTVGFCQEILQETCSRNAKAFKLQTFLTKG